MHLLYTCCAAHPRYTGTPMVWGTLRVLPMVVKRVLHFLHTMHNAPSFMCNLIHPVNEKEGCTSHHVLYLRSIIFFFIRIANEKGCTAIHPIPFHSPNARCTFFQIVDLTAKVQRCKGV